MLATRSRSMSVRLFTLPPNEGLQLGQAAEQRRISQVIKIPSRLHPKEIVCLNPELRISRHTVLQRNGPRTHGMRSSALRSFKSFDMDSTAPSLRPSPHLLRCANVDKSLLRQSAGVPFGSFGGWSPLSSFLLILLCLSALCFVLCSVLCSALSWCLVQFPYCNDGGDIRFSALYRHASP